MDRDNELIACARAAAERLFDEAGETSDIFEPTNEHTAEAAVRRFSELFAGLPGIAKTVMESAQSSGDLVSSDPLQG